MKKGGFNRVEDWPVARGLELLLSNGLLTSCPRGRGPMNSGVATCRERQTKSRQVAGA